MVESSTLYNTVRAYRVAVLFDRVLFRGTSQEFTIRDQIVRFVSEPAAKKWAESAPTLNDDIINVRVEPIVFQD